MSLTSANQDLSFYPPPGALNALECFSDRSAKDSRGFCVALRVSIAAHAVLLLILWIVCPLRKQFHYFNPASFLIVEWGYSRDVSKDRKVFHKSNANGGVIPSNDANEETKAKVPNSTRVPAITARERTLQDDVRQAKRDRAGDRHYSFNIVRTPVTGTAVQKSGSDDSLPAVVSGEIPIKQQQTASAEEFRTTSAAPAKVEAGMPVDLPAKKTILPDATASSGGMSGGADFEFAEKPFIWDIQHDRSLSGRRSFHFEGGRIVVDKIEKSKEFNVHSEAAWEKMEEACLAEWHSQTARLRGKELEYRKWHEFSRAPLEEALVELNVYLNESEIKNEPEVAFHTYANLASCYAMLNRSDEAIASYREYERRVPVWWNRAHGHFGLGTIFLVNGDLRNAKAMLRKTVAGKEIDRWTTYNDEAAFRVITWEILAHIEGLLGEQDASGYSRRQAIRSLEDIRSSTCGNMPEQEFVGTFLNKLGIQSDLMEEFASRPAGESVPDQGCATE